jgi:hypothetical protein
MKNYVATYTVETGRRRYQEVQERFPSEDDASAIVSAQNRIPEISSLYEKAPTILRTLVEIRRVSLKGLVKKVG